MPIPMNCNGCGKPMVHKYDEYLTAVKKYQQQQQQQQKSEQERSPEFMAMAELCIWNDCCRAMYLSTHDIDALIQ